MAAVNVRRLTACCALTVLCVLAAGCTSDPPAAEPPVPTVPAQPSTTSAPPTSTGPRLPSGCGSLLSTQEVDLALGRPLVGRVRSVVGVPEPAIGRLERVTCQYGLPEEALPAGQQVPLEVSVSVYADEAAATERVDTTIESERSAGAAPSTVPVGPVEGTLLVSSGRRLLVAASAEITLAITIAPGLVDDRVADVLADLGGRVLTAVT